MTHLYWPSESLVRDMRGPPAVPFTRILRHVILVPNNRPKHLFMFVRRIGHHQVDSPQKLTLLASPIVVLVFPCEHPPTSSYRFLTIVLRPRFGKADGVDMIRKRDNILQNQHCKGMSLVLAALFRAFPGILWGRHIFDNVNLFIL